ncbi:MAG: CD225/dispanin family protein [Paludibacteraceae bacterium]|nr:CD225/dispanin family protein [Paludibacteraceae bacterium]MBR6041697.1 CD225/dispanin family protein [Paludibacteraceae bacterium]MCR5570230.1 CD225/dispanin family protein [Paludibacteraceae bacterium]
MANEQTTAQEKEKEPYDVRHSGNAPKFDARDPYLPDDHLILSISTTIMCFNPLGIVAILKSRKVNKLFIEGKFEEAKKASSSALYWCIFSTFVAIVFWAIYILYFMD